MQTANKLFGNYAKCKRNDNETISERTRKEVHMDSACKFDNGAEEQHLPTHIHTKPTGLYIPQPELVMSWLEWCWKASPTGDSKWNKPHDVLICYLSQVERGIKKLSDYKLDQEVLRHEITQKLFAIINNCICRLWDMGAGASPEILKAEVLQGSSAYLEYYELFSF